MKLLKHIQYNRTVRKLRKRTDYAISKMKEHTYDTDPKLYTSWAIYANACMVEMARVVVDYNSYLKSKRS